ncbi:MAG: hypothetical protein H6739_23635 [Alphaproteobacteria bacterium]|nr:hypothetical protein [Alphaproteobacteria bacterium]
MRVMLLAALYAPAAFAGPADCEAPASAEALAQAMTEAEQSYMNLDAEGFEAAVDEGDALLRCLAEPVTPALAAQVHRVTAIHSFASGTLATAEPSFAAARVLEPHYRFPEKLIDPGSKPAQLYASQSTMEGVIEALPPPTRGTLLFDGREGTGRPAQRATIAQHVGPSGEVWWSAYLLPGQPMPEDVGRNGQPERSPWLRRAPLIGVGVAAGAGAGLLYRQALLVEDDFYDDSAGHSPQDYRDLQSQANTLGALGIAAGGVALASTVTLVWVW